MENFKYSVILKPIVYLVSIEKENNNENSKKIHDNENVSRFLTPSTVFGITPQDKFPYLGLRDSENVVKKVQV